MPRAQNRSPLTGNGDFMLAGWGEPEPTRSGADPVVAFTADRRDRLARAIPNERLVIPAGSRVTRSNDSDYVFRPGTDHVWLTGNTVADSVLVIDTADGVANSVLYLHPPSGRLTDEFWQNDAIGDLWVGPRPSLAETQEYLGIKCRPLGDLPEALDDSRPTRVVPTIDPAVDALVRRLHGPEFRPHLELKRVLDELRLVKSEWEIAQLQLAVDATVRGFEDCVSELSLARAAGVRGERYLEGTFNRRARLEGEGPAYAIIVGGGSHATTLHWTENSGALNDGELVLLDMGVELKSLYCADVTRTLPVSGAFTGIQRDVYSIVLRAQQAGIDSLRDGVPFQDYQDACSRSLTEGLIDLGLLSCSADEAMDPAAQYFRRWSISRSGHMLGMDVHDCNHAPTDSYLTGNLSAGHMLTVEPGLYFQRNDLTVPEELRGIGIRIEDDLLVTGTGAINLSAGLPRDPDEIEAWMADRV